MSAHNSSGGGPAKCPKCGNAHPGWAPRIFAECPACDPNGETSSSAPAPSPVTRGCGRLLKFGGLRCGDVVTGDAILCDGCRASPSPERAAGDSLLRDLERAIFENAGPSAALAAHEARMREEGRQRALEEAAGVAEGDSDDWAKGYGFVLRGLATKIRALRASPSPPAPEYDPATVRAIVERLRERARDWEGATLEAERDNLEDETTGWWRTRARTARELADTIEREFTDATKGGR